MECRPRSARRIVAVAELEAVGASGRIDSTGGLLVAESTLAQAAAVYDTDVTMMTSDDVSLIRATDSPDGEVVGLRRTTDPRAAPRS